MKKMVPGVVCFLCFFVMKGYAQPAVGKQAPEISLKDENGVVQNLSDNKGKLVLIDFWASWCAPCRRSNQELVPFYKKYRTKGFEIFAISLDQKPDDWKRAIVADKIRWKQVIESGGWDASVAQTWGIEQLPSSYLLDKNGTIIAINPTKKEIAKYLKKSGP